MSKNLETELNDRIAAFASEITTILQRAVANSVSQALAVRPTGARGRGKAALGGRARIDGAEVLREVQKKGGRRMEELKVALRTPTRVLRPALKKLIAEKKVKTTGQARGTKYFAA